MGSTSGEARQVEGLAWLGHAPGTKVPLLLRLTAAFMRFVAYGLAGVTLRVEGREHRPSPPYIVAAAMGFLWLGVAPLVTGIIGRVFGLTHFNTLYGVVFMSHQIGSFLGAYGGGLIYDQLGSYTMAWRIGVALGLAGGIIQVAFALIRPSQPPMLRPA